MAKSKFMKGIENSRTVYLFIVILLSTGGGAWKFAHAEYLSRFEHTKLELNKAKDSLIEVIADLEDDLLTPFNAIDKIRIQRKLIRKNKNLNILRRKLL